MTVPTVALNDGATIPQLGFGVFRVDPEQTERIVSDALEVGYRHIDTAAVYGNEIGVGKAIAASGIPREELFITTKLWNSDQGTQSAFDAIDLSLEKLGLSHVDLYLIHWPVPSRNLYLDSWLALEKIKASGTTTSIGVSNFRADELDRVISNSSTVPTVNQIELHPAFTQKALRDADAARKIVTESWGPLGHAGIDLMGLGPISAAANAHDVTPAQAIIRWHIQHGLVVIPKSNNRPRIAENFDVFGFELTADEMAAIDSLDTGVRVGSDPDVVGAA